MFILFKKTEIDSLVHLEILGNDHRHDFHIPDSSMTIKYESQPDIIPLLQAREEKREGRRKEEGRERGRKERKDRGKERNCTKENINKIKIIFLNKKI